VVERRKIQRKINPLNLMEFKKEDIMAEDALKILAGMEIEIDSDKDSHLIDIKVNGKYQGNLCNRGDNASLAHGIQQLPEIAEQLETRLSGGGCPGATALESIIAAAIRGPKVEVDAEKERYRKALESIAKLTGYLPGEIAKNALEAE